MSKYNGYKNWTTWNCKLWFDEVGMTNYIHELLDENDMTVEQLADYIEEYHWNEYEEKFQQSNFFTNIISISLQEIDFYEIAEKIKDCR